jgi:hypothetical protein
MAQADQGRKPGTANKLSTARVERALAAGKRLPPENLLLVADREMSSATATRTGTLYLPVSPTLMMMRSSIRPAPIVLDRLVATD